MIKAPIALFAYARMNRLRDCVESLKKNEESRDTDLIVFVDGPKAGKEKEVGGVKDYIETITGFKSVTYYYNVTNIGLGQSIIDGVSLVLRQSDSVIVVEDDLIVGKNFLSFLNQGIKKYKHTKEVFSICGYTNKVEIPLDYQFDAYFCSRSSSWGWATWKDRWCSCDWELEDWDSVQKNANAFNKWGGSDCYGMLKAWKEGKNRSWAIRFCYNQFVQNKVSLFPVISHVVNNGFDGEGENCPKWSRFKCDFDESDNKEFLYPDRIEINKDLFKAAMSYNTLLARGYSKIMNFFYR